MLRSLARSFFLSAAQNILPQDLYIPNSLRIILLHGQDGDLPLANLRLILQALSVHCTFIDFDYAYDLLTRPNHQHDNRSYITFSIDDGLKNSLPILEVLSSFEVPAIQYICPFFCQ